MLLTIHVWRQATAEDDGEFVAVSPVEAREDMSILDRVTLGAHGTQCELGAGHDVTRGAREQSHADHPQHAIARQYGRTDRANELRVLVVVLPAQVNLHVPGHVPRGEQAQDGSGRGHREFELGIGGVLEHHFPRAGLGSGVGSVRRGLSGGIHHWIILGGLLGSISFSAPGSNERPTP